MFRVFTIDPTPIKEQLTSMMEACIEAACRQTKAAIEEVPQTPPTVTVVNQNIEGLREQIHANATLLLPILQPEAVVPSTNSIRRIPITPITPKLYVVLSTLDHGVEAYVMHGYDTTPKKTKFIFGDKGATAAEALKKLLYVTMTLVQTHVFEAKNVHEGTTMKTAGGGYITHNPNASPNAPEDAVFWGSSAEPSPTFPANISFKSNSSSTGSEGIHLAVKTPSVNGSFNKSNSFRGNGSVYGNGVGPHATLKKEYIVPGDGSFHLNGKGVNGIGVRGMDLNGSFRTDNSMHSNGVGMNGSFNNGSSFQSNGGSFYGDGVSKHGSFVAV